MNAYVIQHIKSGAYIAPKIGHHIVDPHRAYKFCGRQAATDYIRRMLPAGLYRPAILPATRPLLSEPLENPTC